MENTDDYYTVLGVDRTCGLEQLKQSFRRLALVYHPDKKATGDEAKFRLIERAFKTLSNAESRAAYDAELDNAARLDYPVWQVVTLNDLDEDDTTFTMECRCGGTMTLDKSSATPEKCPLIIECEDCSTFVRVNADN